MKKQKIIGWVLAVIVALIFIMSASMKLSLNSAALEQAKALGMEASTFRILGVIELISVTLFLFPRTGIAGALLLVAYMGGAIAVHLMLKQPLIVGIIIEAIIWVAAIIRFPELKERLFKN